MAGIIKNSIRSMAALAVVLTAALSCTRELESVKVTMDATVAKVSPKQALIQCSMQIPEKTDTMKVEYGIILSESEELSQENSLEIPAGSHSSASFGIRLEHLDCGTQYFYRIYFKYDGEYQFGQTKSFRTAELPKGAVDLKLSNDVLWADRNLGADSIEGLGDGYAFGETAPKERYLAKNYRFFDKYDSHGRMSISKYTFDDGKKKGGWYDADGNFVGDGKVVLDPEDDAATRQLGDGWRIPRPEDFYVLHNECRIFFDRVDGVNGAFAYTRFGEIFLPFPYQYIDDRKILQEGMGIYRTSQLWAGKKPVVMEQASDECMVYWFLRTNLDINTIDAIMARNSFRELGLAIRPVYDCNIEAD